MIKSLLENMSEDENEEKDSGNADPGSKSIENDGDLVAARTHTEVV